LYIKDASGGNVNIFGDYSVKVRMNMHLVLNGYMSGSSNLNILDFFFVFVFVGLDAERSLHKQTNKQTTVDIPDEMPARILHSAAATKKREDKLRRTTSDLRTRVAKCIKRDIGILEYLL